jgi:hypothetical protein
MLEPIIVSTQQDHLTLRSIVSIATDCNLCAQERFDGRLLTGAIELNRRVHIRNISHRHCGHLRIPNGCCQLLNPGDAIYKRIFGMNIQVYKRHLAVHRAMLSLNIRVEILLGYC